MQQQHFGVAPELAPAPAPPLPGGDGDDGAGGAIGDQQQRAAAVKALLDEARAALAANSAPRALELVVAALQRLGGGAAVGPALRAAVEAFRGQQQAQHQQHQQQQAPRIDELAALLAQVSLAAAASCEQQQQQQTPWPPPSQPHPFGAHAAPAWPLPQQQPQQQQLLGHQQQQQPQPWPPPPPQPLPQPAAAAAAILEETGRGGLAAAAMADGSSGACPHCGGVLPRERMQAHLELWCPALGSRAH